jgi:hypothetical protein
MAQSSFVIVSENTSTCGCGASLSLAPKSRWWLKFPETNKPLPSLV